MRIRSLALSIALALIFGLAAVAPLSAQTDPDIVATVGDAPITRDDFHARVRFVRWQYLQEIAKLHELTAGNLGLTAGRVLTLLNSLRNPDELGAEVLTQMEDELLARAEAERLGIELSAEAIAARRDEFFSLWTGVEVEALADDASAQAFIEEWYASAQEASGLEREAIDEVFATEALWDALYERIAAQAPSEELTIHSRHILCSFDTQPGEDLTPETCIRTAQERLAGGEPFEDVAADLSADAATAQRGGDLGWIPLSYLVDGYAEAAESATLNAVIGPVETSQGLHLIQVLEREVRPLSERDQAQARADLFAQWLDELHAGASLTRADDWAADIPHTPGLDTLLPDVLAALEQLETMD